MNDERGNSFKSSSALAESVSSHCSASKQAYRHFTYILIIAFVKFSFCAAPMIDTSSIDFMSTIFFLVVAIAARFELD